MTIGERLKQERERLRLSQPAFAAVAGTTKQTLFSWESGKTAPDCFQMAALADVGVDVLYVLTGEYAGGIAPAPGLTAEEQTLLDYFREASREVRRAALGALIGAQPAGTQLGSVNVTSKGQRGGVQVGVNSGTITSPRKTGR